MQSCYEYMEQTSILMKYCLLAIAADLNNPFRLLRYKHNKAE